MDQQYVSDPSCFLRRAGRENYPEFTRRSDAPMSHGASELRHDRLMLCLWSA